MSGIAGIFNRDGRPVERALLGRMTDAIAHRGPDGAHQWIDGAVGFGHQMLCTTPESLHETQPLRDASGQLCLVLDGRVDNRDELKEAIEARGGRLRDDTDAELVLQSYVVWSEECPKQIIGDFAFAIWDARKQQLFCARDFLGIKPFYYYVDERTFRFGSELQQILADTDIKRRPNEGMIGEYLANAITSQEETLFQGILRLPPGHALTVQHSQVTRQRYWEPDFSKKIRYKTDKEYAEHFLEIFKEAIRCRMRSVGPVGVALSGGLDSSSIACVAQSLCREDSNNAPDLVALSEVFPGEECDESRYIQDVVQMWDIKSYTFQRTDTDIDVFSEQVQRYLDFPGFPNSSSSSDPVSILACEQNIRVLLGGLGGDEWLSGSLVYYADLMSHFKIGLLLQQFCYDVRSIGVKATLKQLLWYGLNPLIPQGARDVVKLLFRKRPAISACVHTEFARRIGLAERARNRSTRSSLLNVACKDIWRSANEGFHVFAYESEERAAAWLGFEQRHPFHDRRLIEFVLAIPEEQRYRQGWIKYVLRTAMQEYLPNTVQQRWDKAEFSLLFGRMLMEPFIKRLFDKLTIESLGWIAGEAAREMYQRTLLLYSQCDVEYKRYVWRLWMVVGVELWYDRTFVNSEAPISVELGTHASTNKPSLAIL